MFKCTIESFVSFSRIALSLTLTKTYPAQIVILDVLLTFTVIGITKYWTLWNFGTALETNDLRQMTNDCSLVECRFKYPLFYFADFGNWGGFDSTEVRQTALVSNQFLKTSSLTALSVVLKTAQSNFIWLVIFSRSSCINNGLH